MARIARVVAPGCYHHLAQWGNGGRDVFFQDEDKEFYLELLNRYGEKAGISFVAYCLLDNHVHLVAIPEKPDSFARGIGLVHREYTREVNGRLGRRGALWKGRFMSYPFDESYLLRVVCFVERTPLRRAVVRSPEEYRWSSFRARLHGDDAFLVPFTPGQRKDWDSCLKKGNTPFERARFKQHLSTGRPLGPGQFIFSVEELTVRDLHKKKPGPKIKRSKVSL